jgi:hypothetical protein
LRIDFELKLALSPALSPGEREKLIPSWGIVSAVVLPTTSGNDKSPNCN